MRYIGGSSSYTLLRTIPLTRTLLVKSSFVRLSSFPMLKYFKPVVVSSASSSSSLSTITSSSSSATTPPTTTTNNSNHANTTTSSTTLSSASPRRTERMKRTAEEMEKESSSIGSPSSKSTAATTVVLSTTTTTIDHERISIAAKEKELLKAQALTSPTAQAQLELLHNSEPIIDLTTDDTESSSSKKLARTIPSTTASSTVSTSSSFLSSTVSIPSTTTSTDEEKSILAQFGLAQDSSWASVVLTEIRKPYFTKLLKFLNEARKKNPNTIYPPQLQVFSALSLTPLDNVKVVILGQDPYHGPGQAHGLAFSVQKGIALPPSLVNILKEVDADIRGNSSSATPKASHGNLEYWARQGVLLLNAVLTVEKAQPNSHAKQGWETFTGAILKAVAERKEKVVFLCWGAPAQERAKFISRTRHCVLEAPHPSPLSVYRGFSGCKHFSKTNAYLQQHGKVPVDWSLDKA